MRLRLNTTLRAALIAAITAVGFTLTAGQQAQAATPESYSGLILTWNNTTKNADLAYGKYRETDYVSGEFSDKGIERAGWKDPVQGLIGTNNTDDRNTLRFAANTYGQTVKAIEYTFTPLALAGFIVDSGAEGYSIVAKATGSDRTFYLGNDNTNTAAYSSINEDFTFDKLGGGNKVFLRGIQTIDVASDKTFTLGSNNGFDFTSNLDLTVTGGGTLAFTRGGVTMASGASLTVQAGSTVSFASAVSGLSTTINNAGKITFASDTVTLGSDLSGFDDYAPTYEDYTGEQADNGFVVEAACSIIKNTGVGQSNLSKVVYGGNTYNLDANGKVVVGENYTTYYLNTDGATVDLAQAITWSSGALTTVVAKGKTSTITVNSNSTLGSLSIASGSTATVNGDGCTMKIGTLTNEGELAIGAGATVSLAADVTLDGSHKLDNVTGDGTFAIQKLTVNGGTHNLGVGMNMTDIALNGGTLAFTNGTSTVSGKLISESNDSELVVGTDSNAAVLKVNRLENGNINNEAKHSDITINSKGTLKITGNDTRTDYKQGSLILGEWNVIPTTVTVKGLLIADQVAATAGDSGYVMNINGGTALLKGLQRKSGDRKQEINISNDGKLILGSTGIVGTNTGSNVSLTVNGGTIGIYADNVTIDKNVTVSGATTFDTQKYTVNDITVAQGATGGALTVSGNITGAGTINKEGAGTLTLSGSLSEFTGAMNVNAGTLVVTQGVNASSVTVGTSGSLTLGGAVTFANNKALTNNGTVTLDTTSLEFDLNGLTAAQSGDVFTYTLFSGNAVNLSGLTTGNIALAGGTAGKEWVFGTNGTISYTISASNRVWTGTDGIGNWNYEEANWNGEQFAEGDIAVFNIESQVTVNADVVAAGIQVTDGALATIMNDETTSGALTVASLDVHGTLITSISIDGVESYTMAEESAWTICAEQTLAAGTGTNNGSIWVWGQDASLTFTGTATADDLVGVTNDGTVAANFGDNAVRLDMADSTGTLEVKGGIVDYRSKLGEQTLKLGNGTKLLFGDNDGTKDAPDFTNDILLDGNATVQVWGSSKHSSVTISGDVTGEGHTLTKADGDQNLIFSGKVNIGGLSTASDGNGTIIFSGGEGSLGNIALNGSSTTVKFSAKDGAKNEYTFNTLALSPGQSNATRWLVVDKDVTVHGTGNSVGDSSTIHSGWGVKNGGLEVNGVLTTDSTIGLEAANQTAYIKGTGIINTTGLNLCNGSTTYIQDGITINITSGKGIYARSSTAGAGSIHLKKATLQATTADWEFKVGRADDPVTLEDATDGTTFEAAAERTITISKALGGTGKLVKAGEGTVILNAANSYAGGTVINAGKVVASNDSALGSGNVTIAEDAALEVNVALNLGGRLQSSGSITVNAEKSLTLTAGSSINEAITNNGTVNLTAITLGEGFEEQGGGTGYFDLEGNKVESTVNHYMGTNESYVQVVNNAAGASSTGTAVWGDKTLSLESDGRIITNAGVAEYDTFYVITGETLSNITGAEHGSDLKAINVAGGELVVNETASGIDITVAENASVSGSNLDVTQVGIAADKTATVKQQLAVSGVTFTPAEGAGVGIKNTGEQLAQYSTSDTNMEVTAKTLTMSDAQNNVTVSNQLVVDEIVNTTGKVLTLDNVTDVMELTNMDITGSTAKVGYITGEEPVFTEATVSISGVLQGGEATLLANLKLVGGSTLDVDGGADKALTLGSKLTFDLNEGGLVNLDQVTIDALAGLSDGQSLDLIVAANGTQLDYVGAQTGMDYAQLFAPAEGLTGNYVVYAKGDAFGVTKQGAVPEPTTGTLSLLALAALAARRRRK